MTCIRCHHAVRVQGDVGRAPVVNRPQKHIAATVCAYTLIVIVCTILYYNRAVHCPQHDRTVACAGQIGQCRTIGLRDRRCVGLYAAHFHLRNCSHFHVSLVR